MKMPALKPPSSVDTVRCRLKPAVQDVGYGTREVTAAFFGPPALAGIFFILALLLTGCSKEDKPQDAKAPPARTFTDSDYLAAFHRGVSELEQHRFVEAAQTFDELTKSRPNLVAPWINLASSQLNRNVEAAHPLCIAATDRATALDPKAPQPYFLRGILFKHLGKFEDAEKNFREALKYAPDDPATLYHLSSLVADKDLPQAVALLEKAIEDETHLSSAYYSLMGLKRRTDRSAVEQFMKIFQAFEAANTGAKMNIVYTEMGRLGEAVRDLPGMPPPVYGLPPPKTEFADPITIPGMALAVIDSGGKPVIVCRQSDGKLEGHSWAGKDFERVQGLFPEFVTKAPNLAIGDFDDDGHDDLALTDTSGTQLLKFDGKAFKEGDGNPLGAANPAKGCLWSDLDQDGDLDLVLWNDDEIVFLLNRRDGKFERFDPKPAESRKEFQSPPLPKVGGKVGRACASDLDGDGDPDILIATDHGLQLWRNDRLMRFTDVTARAGLDDSGSATAFSIEALDGDRALDILTIQPGGRVKRWTQSRGPFRLTFSGRTLAEDPQLRLGVLRVGDLDADGNEDVVTATPKDLRINSRTWVGDSPATLEAPSPTGLLLADLDRNLTLDLIVSCEDGNTRIYLGKKPPQNHAIEIQLKGKKFANTMHSNMGGIGARVEVMAGNRSQVREMRSNEGSTLHFGLGTHTNADYVRIIWPDDVLQSEGWVPGDQVKVIEEFQRKASSCPILFAWNGERFECVTDFMGVGGLGFFIEPGVYGAPDPTEQILIPKLEPKDGKLEIRIHEPFEEITYLDAAKLIAVDHPADVDVVPDERFSVNAPQPDGKLLAIKKRIDPIAARDGRGNDVLDAVLKSDRKQAHAVADKRFLGYAEPTAFTFDFGAGLEERAGSDQIYVALDGWVEYPYSHINLAAWQAGLRLEALSVEVEVAGKGFVRIQNEACYPAGMPRVMTLPLGKLPDGLTGKLRLVTNQELWIDRLFLFRPADVKLTARTLQASSAQLRTSGFPREYSPDGGAPRLYDYDIRDPSFPWKTMAGTYTAFGEVGELLREADDCTVIFGGGEEIAMTFDPPPPPAAGMKRTYILDTAGWCKDMDPYTAFPYTVEPLPFRAMSNYPYRADESFPDGRAQRAWHAKYQTRTMPGTRAR